MRSHDSVKQWKATLFGKNPFAPIVFGAVLFVALWTHEIRAISYTTEGSLYSQDFNGLPTDTRQNNTIQSGATGSSVDYINGWADDTTTVSANHISIPGWYLYHSLQPGGATGENGTTHHQRLRFGSGSGTTGAFYGFATGSTNPEKALGFLPSTSVATAPQPNPLADNDDIMFIGLKLTNGSGQTINQFTLKYDGEQWRDGGRGDQTTLTSSVNFSWKINPINIHQISGFNNVPELGFTSPVANNNPTPTGAAVDGNGAGKVPVAAFTVTGINWTAGSDLWLRWGDQQLDGNDHGMAIDNVKFTAGVPAFPDGDYNHDFVVDAADYVMWRLTNGENPAGYDLWRANFGATPPPVVVSALGSALVPEPTGIALLALALPILAFGRRNAGAPLA